MQKNALGIIKKEPPAAAGGSFFTIQIRLYIKMLDGLDGGAGLVFPYLAQGKKMAGCITNPHTCTSFLVLTDLSLINFTAVSAQLFVKSRQFNGGEIAK